MCMALGLNLVAGFGKLCCVALFLTDAGLKLQHVYEVFGKACSRLCYMFVKVVLF